MIETKFQFIRFAKVEPDPKKKTDAYICLNVHSNDQLGVISWYGPWRQYCFFVGSVRGEVVFSAGCLKDIQTFIKSLMDERKKV